MEKNRRDAAAVATNLFATTTPASRAAKATSKGSRVDYSCYTIRSTETDRRLAVVIETKMECSRHHAIAQVCPFIFHVNPHLIFVYYELFNC